MTLSLPELLRRAIATLTAPREAAEAIIAMHLSRNTAWQLLATVVLVSVVLTESVALLMTAVGMRGMGGPFAGPMTLAIVQGSLTVAMVFAIHWVGRAFGGHGRLSDAVALIAWLQFILLCLQVLQIAFLVILPILSWYIGVLGLVVFFWLLTHFVAVLHDFDSLGRAFGMILVAMMGVAVGLMILLSLIGVQLPEAPQNV